MFAQIEQKCRDVVLGLPSARVCSIGTDPSGRRNSIIFRMPDSSRYSPKNGCIPSCNKEGEAPPVESGAAAQIAFKCRIENNRWAECPDRRVCRAAVRPEKKRTRPTSVGLAFYGFVPSFDTHLPAERRNQVLCWSGDALRAQGPR